MFMTVSSGLAYHVRKKVPAGVDLSAYFLDNVVRLERYRMKVRVIHKRLVVMGVLVMEYLCIQTIRL